MVAEVDSMKTWGLEVGSTKIQALEVGLMRVSVLEVGLTKVSRLEEGEILVLVFDRKTLKIRMSSRVQLDWKILHFC
jgi:hypothetical protein